MVTVSLGGKDDSNGNSGANISTSSARINALGHAKSRHMRNLCFSFVCIVQLLSAASSLQAEYSAILTVSERTEVSAERITMGDVALVENRMLTERKLDQLKTITIGRVAKPRQVVELAGGDIVRKIQEAGFDTKEIGYTVPRSITIVRSGREISLGEVEQSLRELLKTSDAKLEVRSIGLSTPLYVGPGEVKVLVDLARDDVRSRVDFSVVVEQGDEVVARGKGSAILDGVVNCLRSARALELGEMVSGENVVVAAIPLKDNAVDAVCNLDEASGKVTKVRLDAGAPIRRVQLQEPVTIVRGSKVELQFQSGLFAASAEGVAAEDGYRGKKMRVRNARSKQVVEGIVRDSNVVDVVSNL